jgi:hypothetical protein
MNNYGTKQRTNQSVAIPNKRRLAFCMKLLVVVAVGLAGQAGAAIRTSSISFDGVNSYALFANPFYQSQTLTNWSIEMWFKTRNILGGNRAAQQLWGKSGFWKDVWITFETNGVIGCWYSYPSPETYWGVVSGSGVVKNLTWHQVAAVMSGTNLQLFVDGNNVTNAVGNGQVNWAQDSGGASTGLNMLGQEEDGNFGTNDRFNGMISEFRIWNTALSQSDIQNNMNTQLNPAIHPELVGYWTMAQGSGSTVADLVSTNTLTLCANAGWTNDAPPISQIEGSGIPTNLLQGLVAYYPFNGNASDASGNGNNGTPLNTQSASDRFGNANAALAFNGINGSTSASMVVVSNALINLGQLGYTINLWFMPSNLTQVTRSIFSGANTDVGLEIGFNNNNEPGTIDFFVGPGNAFWSSLNNHSPVMNFQVGQWYSISLTKSNLLYSLYINGQLEDQVTVAAAAGYNYNIEPLIGAYYPDGSQAFTGNIDDVRIYNRALSTNEVQQLYAYESQPTPVPCVSPATATATVVDGFVVAATITDGGCGYTNTPRVLIEGGGGTGAGVTAVVSNGVVVSITNTNAGIGYTSTPLVVIQPPFIPNPVLGIAPMSFLAFSNLTVGGVYQLQESVAWYWSNQPVSFTATNVLYTQMVAGVAGSGDYRLALNPVPAQAFATPQVVNGFVVGATVTSGGSGYVTSPAVAIVGGGGTNATAVSQISGGVVTNITITDAGSGYTNTPTVEIAPPPAAAVSPIVLPMMRVDCASLSPYDNYQIQFKLALGGAWANWSGGLFSPTAVTNSQYLFISNGVGFFRLQYVP